MSHRSSVTSNRVGYAHHACACAELPHTCCRHLEGVPLPGLSLGPLPLLRQRLRIGGTTFSLVMPADVDQVLDLYIDAGESMRMTHAPMMMRVRPVV